jgi:ABC-type multidrug transport system ATPase subunit
MEKLGIAHLKDSRIGWGDGERGRGIGRGEMRRVTIGVELVAEPDMLILDEPTSGLDSVSAAKITQVLHALAHDEENPTAVLATIHQPRFVSPPPFLPFLIIHPDRSSKSSTVSSSSLTDALSTPAQVVSRLWTI